MFNPLEGWLSRKHPIPNRFYTQGIVDAPNSKWNAWLSIEECSLLHKVNSMNWLSLRQARIQTAHYLDSAAELIGGLEGGWLDREEQLLLINQLGAIPLPSLPIYLISCGEGNDEQLVYVGKTKNTSRFSGGHAVALKLHAPKYQSMPKRVYRSTIWFYFNEEYISLDWIQPEKLALKILDSIESQLIYSLQPALNTHKKKANLALWDFRIHIQNFQCGNFLNDILL